VTPTRLKLVLPRAFVFAALIALVVAGAASAAFPGRNGKIAYTRSTDLALHYDIFTMRSDGTVKRNITSSATDEFDPAWSANGKRFAYVRGAGGNFDVFTMASNGSNRIRVAFGAGVQWEPAWAPDGTKVVFSSDADGDFEICVVDLGTGVVTQLTTNNASDGQPVWSKQGRIAFASNSDGDFELYTMKPDGSDLRQVTHNLVSDTAPNWAPGGVRLAFARRVGARSEIYVIKADGTQVHRLTRNQKADSAPAWSPNGRKIAFQRQWDNTDLSGRIWTMLRDGTIQRPRTPRSSDAKQPDWQPLPLP
jgi:tol-pal system beta propeller repeat protein TolB